MGGRGLAVDQSSAGKAAASSGKAAREEGKVVVAVVVVVAAPSPGFSFFDIACADGFSSLAKFGWGLGFQVARSMSSSSW